MSQDKDNGIQGAAEREKDLKVLSIYTGGNEYCTFEAKFRLEQPFLQSRLSTLREERIDEPFLSLLFLGLFSPKLTEGPAFFVHRPARTVLYSVLLPKHPSKRSMYANYDPLISSTSTQKIIFEPWEAGFDDCCPRDIDVAAAVAAPRSGVPRKDGARRGVKRLFTFYGRRRLLLLLLLVLLSRRGGESIELVTSCSCKPPCRCWALVREFTTILERRIVRD